VWNQPVVGTLRNRNLRTSVGKPVRYSIQSSVWRTTCLGSGVGMGSGIDQALAGGGNGTGPGTEPYVYVTWG
jgi:hypothetical protein